MKGHATPEGTRRRLERADRGDQLRELGPTGLSVSAFGFGGYRVDEVDPQHRAALRRALTVAGVNLIDTSSNYGGGRSERLVGEVLAERVGAGSLARDEVVVVSKVGYLQGALLEEVRDLPELEAVRLSEQHWHSIDPRVVRRVVEHSRRRLGLDAIDVYLLHNPEYLLAELTEDAFYDAVRRAFEVLEELCDAGAIGGYGVSSNTLGSAPGTEHRTEFSRLLAAAEGAGGSDHRLRVLQLPLNLLEREPLQGFDGAPSVLDQASAAGLGVLTNRPLNAFDGERLLRLADGAGRDRLADYAPARRALAELEAGLPGRGLDLSRRVPRAMPQLGSAAAFDSYAAYQVRPAVRQIAPGFAASGSAGYREAVERLLQGARAMMAAKDAEALAPVFDALGDGADGEPWSRRALRWTATRPGVTSVLVGMRRPAYVDDVAAVTL